MKRIIGGIGMVLALACAGQQASVRLQGDPRSIASLAGQWSGEYRGALEGRRGSLSFELRPGSDTLYGDVLMMDVLGNVLRPADAVEVHRMHVQSSRLLQIEFVQARGDSIRGVLEPYTSPECNCVVTTIFAGALRGDRITGIFETGTAARGVLARGSWEMTRTP